MFLRIEGYFCMSLTCFDRNPKNLSIFTGTCLSAAVEKDVNVDVFPLVQTTCVYLTHNTLWLLSF